MICYSAMVIFSTDVGSLVPKVGVSVLDAFIDKLKAGVIVPTYPQFGDMNQTFIDLISNNNSPVPELEILRKNLSYIKDEMERDFIPIKGCFTGPYTLALAMKNERTISDISDSLCKIVEKSIFKDKYGEVQVICIDEPVFGFLDDPTLDYGSQGRENLGKAWDNICKIATDQGIQTCIHLHNTSNKLFWEVKHLNMIESHVGDPIYSLESTKKNLEETDKFLKASIAITRFDDLIIEKVGVDKLAETWVDIICGKIHPELFLEDFTTIEKRLSKIIDFFGLERILCAGPECGMNGFPTYDCGIEYLRRISNVILYHNI
jgi:methionine synthase II (cobalamin-independent)